MGALHLAWFGYVSTGLDKADRMLEVAVILTTPSLEEVGRFTTPIIPDPPFNWMDRLKKQPKFLRQHVDTGLVRDLLSGDAPGSAEAEGAVVDFLKETAPWGKYLHVERAFEDYRSAIARNLPRVEQMLLPAFLDVDSIRRFVHDVCVVEPRMVMSVRSGLRNHRAMARAEIDLQEVRRYRDLIGVN